MEIEICKLTKVYRGKTVFKDLCFKMAPGKSYVIEGPNGSGKSTLIRIICGLTRATRGQALVRLEGNILRNEMLGKHLGLVSPDFNLYEHLSAQENLVFFAALRRLQVADGYLQALLSRVQLSSNSSKMPVNLFSSGMKQRLKLACAVLHDPQVLLLDEPATNLDVEGKSLVEEIVTEQRKKNGIVIVATNEPEEVAKYGQEVLSLGASCMGHH